MCLRFLSVTRQVNLGYFLFKFLYERILSQIIYISGQWSWQNCQKFEKRVKGIFSDSNNIFLWHESEDINKKTINPKFQLIPILRFQFMYDYVCFIASIDYCVK